MSAFDSTLTRFPWKLGEVTIQVDDRRQNLGEMYYLLWFSGVHVTSPFPTRRHSIAPCGFSLCAQQIAVAAMVSPTLWTLLRIHSLEQ